MTSLATISLLLCLCSVGVEDETLPAMKILSANCVRCHNPEKTRGGLDLSSRDTALQGGATAETILPGKPRESPLVKRAAEGSMPPEKDGRRLSGEEVRILTDWIQTGAAWPDGVTLPLLVEQPKAKVARPLPSQPSLPRRRFFRRACR